MALSPGTRLGPYEILSALGAGGMGEVYRARDTKLGRDVALKVLPDTFSHDPGRLARFRREAQVLASLNHPHIGGIYGLDELNGALYLVLELIDGENLATRIARGPLPIDEALDIGRQIAEAIEAAHEKGIIHRDLKPANIAVTKHGIVKVLDFGLAKATEAASGALLDLPNSSTVASPTTMTGVGVILGTTAYMSPEQAKEHPADKRSDVWAYGCVLFEMLTGKQAFRGEEFPDTLANVLRSEPDWSLLGSDVPPLVRALLQECLRKDPRRRIADLSTALFVLSERTNLAAPPSSLVSTSTTDPRVRSWSRVAIFSAASAIVTAGLATSLTWLSMAHQPAPLTRLTIPTTGTAALTINGVDRDLTVTPDGTRVLYIGANGTELFVRPLDQLEPKALARGNSLRGVFSSPDGQWVGYIDNLTILKKVAITGGPPITVVTMDANSRGAAWLPDDTIIFATDNPVSGLQRVAAVGGTATVLTRPDRERGESAYLWPETVPTGRAVLFTIMPVSGGLDAAQVAMFDLDAGTQQILVRGGSHGHYVTSGHLVYAAGGTLRAVPFNLARRKVRDTPIAVLSRVVTSAFGAADVAIARDGTLVYADAPGGLARTLLWVDRQGREEPMNAPPRPYYYPRLSPDGTRIVVYSGDQDWDLWLWDMARETLTRLTTDPANEAYGIWTLDGRRVVFSSSRSGRFNLFSQAIDGTRTAERQTESSNNQMPSALTPDGTNVLFHEQSPETGLDLKMLTLGPSRRIVPLLTTRFNESNGVVSPDGHWLAYESDSSGRYEIYVRPFPSIEIGLWLVSTSGGTQPLWSRNGQELFYVAADGGLMAVPVRPRGTIWSTGVPRKVVNGRYVTSSNATIARDYDVSADGQRFLLVKQTGADSTAGLPQIVVVQHWDEELKRLAPAR
jgi:serine/threonine protein kinase/Tol biopolymer transport system component